MLHKQCKGCHQQALPRGGGTGHFEHTPLLRERLEETAFANVAQRQEALPKGGSAAALLMLLLQGDTGRICLCATRTKESPQALQMGRVVITAPGHWRRTLWLRWGVCCMGGGRRGLGNLLQARELLFPYLKISL